MKKLLFLLLIFICATAQSAYAKNLGELVSEARAHDVEHRYDTALRVLYEAQMLDPQAVEVKTLLGRVYYNRELYELARQALNESLGMNPNQAEALLFRARALRKLQYWEQAVADFVASLKLGSENADLAYEAGLFFVERGEFALAKKQHKTLLKLDLPRAEQLWGRIDPSSLEK